MMNQKILFIVAAGLIVGCAARDSDEEAGQRATVQYQIAYESYVNGDLIPALAAALDALKLQPKSVDTRNLLGLIYFRQNKFDEAEKTFIEALKLEPRRSEVHNNLGTLYLEQKKFELAKASFTKALENPLYLYPERIYNNLGLTHEGMKMPAEAIRSYEKSIELNRNFYLSYQNLGKLLVAQGQIKKAKSLLLEAARLCTECSEPRYYLGTIFVKENDREAALKFFKEGAAMDPKGYFGILCSRELVKGSNL